MARKHGLGRGLDALIPQNHAEEQEDQREAAVNEMDLGADGQSEKSIAVGKGADSGTAIDQQHGIKAGKKEKAPISNIDLPSENTAARSDPGPLLVRTTRVEPDKNQPRKNFDQESLEELAASIEKYGIIEPLVVRQEGDHYVIVAGERRWRAAKLAGLKEIPVVIGDYNARMTAEIQLIENIQRKDIDPIEEASAYQRLIEEFGLTQEEVAEAVAKSRTAVTNTLRLLRLAPAVRELLQNQENGLTSGHARALLSIEDEDAQLKAAQKIIEEHLSVRETEKLVKMMLHPRQEKTVDKDPSMEIIYRDQEKRLTGVLGTKVSIVSKNRERGKLEIEYYDNDTLDRIINILMHP